MVRKTGVDAYSMLLNDRGKVATYEITLHKPHLGVRLACDRPEHACPACRLSHTALVGGPELPETVLVPIATFIWASLVYAGGTNRLLSACCIVHFFLGRVCCVMPSTDIPYPTGHCAVC